MGVQMVKHVGVYGAFKLLTKSTFLVFILFVSPVRIGQRVGLQLDGMSTNFYIFTKTLLNQTTFLHMRMFDRTVASYTLQVVVIEMAMLLRVYGY